MLLIQHPLSPQTIVSSKINNQEIEKNIKSLKVQKSRNSILEEQNESLTIVKSKTLQGDFNQFDISVNQKLSPNDTRILLKNEGDSIPIRNNTEDAQIPVFSKKCCYCGETQDILPICGCSFAHKDCENHFLESGPILNQILCKKCNEYKHVDGIVCFDFKQWRNHKILLSCQTTFVLIILIIFGSLTYVLVANIIENIEQERVLISCLVFSYTVGFILLIFTIASILNNFIKIKFVIKRFDPKNIKYNIKNVKRLMEM